MIDPDLKVQLEQINQNLVAIEKKKGAGIWRSFFNGMFNALGYMVGLAIVVVIVGWILQKTGILKGVSDQVKSFMEIMNSAKKLIPQDSKESGAGDGSKQGIAGDTTITLPDGRQMKVNLQNGY